MTELRSLLLMLERVGVEHTLSPISRPDSPTASHMLEVWSSEAYGHLDATSVWIFDRDGALLKLGHFS